MAGDGRSSRWILGVTHMVYICLDGPVVSVFHVHGVRWWGLSVRSLLHGFLSMCCWYALLTPGWGPLQSLPQWESFGFISCSQYLDSVSGQCLPREMNLTVPASEFLCKRMADICCQFEKAWQLSFAQFNFPVRLSGPWLFFGEGVSSLIESSCLILVCSCWLFLQDSVMVGCTFVGLYPFISCYSVCQHGWFSEVPVAYVVRGAGCIAP